MARGLSWSPIPLFRVITQRCMRSVHVILGYVSFGFRQQFLWGYRIYFGGRQRSPGKRLLSGVRAVFTPFEPMILYRSLAPDHTRWVSSQPSFFLPVKVLSRVFRGKFVARLRAAFTRVAWSSTVPSRHLPNHVSSLHGSLVIPSRLDRLGQAPIRRPGTGAALSQRLPASRRHFQPQACCP
jgi:hypothetical protein